MTTILIIEDEPDLVKVLRSYLENAGYVVLTAYRGDSGLQTWEINKPDLVILDLNLPGKDGLDVAREIRRKSNTPIIMITARVEEADQLIGLEVGADDYVNKPFSPRILVARVRSLLRRSQGDSQPDSRIQLDDLVIDLDAHQVIRGEDEIELTPTEFTLLVTMASQPGRAFSRLQLLEATQGTAYEGYERTIDAHIKNLRSKLEYDSKNPQFIETVFGIGYKFSKTTQGSA